MSSTTTIIQGNADSNSEKTAPVVPPTSTNKFFFQPSHIAENERYILTRTTPSLYPNQTRAPAVLSFFASATSSSTSPCTAAWPPAASYTSRRTIKNCPLAAAAVDFGSFTWSKENFCANRT